MDGMEDLALNAAHEPESPEPQQVPPPSSPDSKANPLSLASPPLLNPLNLLSGWMPSNNNSTSNRSLNSKNTNKNYDNRSDTSVAAIEATKYNHDVEQAKRMQQGMTKRKQQQQQQKAGGSIAGGAGELTESDILLGLDGLDQADALRASGRMREALKVSELSIELLIRFLRSDATTIRTDIARDTVEARVLAALSTAEEMKASLNRTSDQQPPHHPAVVASPPNNNAHSLSNSLKVALGRGGQAKTAKVSSTTTPSYARPTKSNQAHQHRQPAGQTTSSLLGGAVGGKTSASLLVRGSAGPTASKRIVSAAAGTSTAPRVASPLANSKDPLVQTIKSELYIDPSQLQSTTWNDIAGLVEAKQALQEAAILPLMRPDLFSGLRRPRNILMYGPPGTGKTMLVKAVAHESQCLLFICTASALTSKWHGEGEKLLRTLFEVARQAAPSIIFVDEMDAMLSNRKSDGEHEASRRFKTEFMTQMDGIVKKGTSGSGGSEKNLLVIAATNTPWDIDDAVLRRFPRRIYIPLPDATTRKALLSKLLETGDVSNHKLSSSDTKAIVRRLSGFSGSDIAAIASEASFGPIRSLGGMDAIRDARTSDIRPIEKQDFDNAIDSATKSVSKKLLKQYETWKMEQQATA